MDNASFDCDIKYLRDGRYDILSMGLERALDSLGIKNIKVKCGETVIDGKDRFEVVMAKKDSEIWRTIYFKSILGI